MLSAHGLGCRIQAQDAEAVMNGANVGLEAEQEVQGKRDAAFRRQMAIGLGLAGLIFAGWIAVHALAVFALDLGSAPWLLVLALAALQTWLSVGLFIVAHDAMHGSLAPFHPRLNRWVGKAALMLYAAFDFDRLIGKHFAHHRHSGSEGDPDFDADHPDRFWPWFFTFFTRYFGLREFLTLGAFGLVWVLVLGAPVANVMLFWALPAILAAFQLFYFGTYRPHRHDDRPFADRHRARSEQMPAWLSLLTCFHFGYHHEHHAMPHVPWWRLPAARRQALKART
jgi:beta-carotene ketolase (CrtW type)